MNGNRIAICALLLSVGSPMSSTTTLAARESNGTAAAKGFFEQGEAAAKAGELSEAAVAFRKAIDADPDFVDAHQRFIEVTQRQEASGSGTPVVPRLQQLYGGWARKYPKRAVYQWALGFLSPEVDKSDVYFTKALAIDPAFARAHLLLARNADQRGDWAAQRAHLKAAVDSNPDDPRYLMRYADAQRKSDPPRFRELALAVVAKFPGSPSAAEALYRLANESSDPERRVYFDRLRANYPVDRYSYASSAMNTLYGELTGASDALALARDMTKALPANKTWAQRVAFQETMARAQALVAEKKFADALELLGKMPRPSGNHGTTWTLLKAEAAAGAGHADQAYTTLAESVAAMPDDRVETALLASATGLGKARPEVEADIWRIRDGKASPAAAFQLPSTRGGAPVQLADYRGRVVLLAFWYPT